jgi:hypothetical protein
METADRSGATTSQLRISFGSRQQLAAFDRFSGKYAGRAEGKKVFVIRRVKGGVRLESRVDDLEFKPPVGPSIRFRKREKRLFSEADFESALIHRGLHWWRTSRVVVRPLMNAPAPAVHTGENLERLWFRKLNQKLALGGLALTILTLVIPKATESLFKDEPLPPSTLVALKKPKIIEKIVLPKPLLHPSLSVASQPKSSKPVPPKPVPRKVDEAALRARQQALAQQKAKADLSKSLGFLSSSATQPAAPTSAPKVANKNARYQSMAQAISTSTSSEALSKLAKTDVAQGPIQTQSVRSMNTQVAIAGGAKTLNEVQGRVSLSAMSAPSGGGGVDSSLTSKGMSIGGDGSLAESEIERALSKHLQRFQYCYEKALLSDPSLAGHILVQWTIGGDGGVSDIKVVRSQLNNSQLQQCLSGEIAKVRFSAPQGGSVIVKYPFAFSSTPL